MKDRKRKRNQLTRHIKKTNDGASNKNSKTKVKNIL